MYCKALGTEISFTSNGFNHLIYKGSHRRSISDIKNRLPLIKLAVPVLSKSTKIGEARVRGEVIKGRSVQSTYLVISKIVGRKNPTNVKVVIKKTRNSLDWKFQSIMKTRIGKKEKSTHK